MLYVVELLKADADDRQAEFDANLEARVFAGQLRDVEDPLRGQPGP
jgi:hypothetical protein